LGYSLAAYPPTPAQGHRRLNLHDDIPDNAGIALFNNNSGGGSFSLPNSLRRGWFDERGEHGVQRGHGAYPALTPFSIDYAFVRDDWRKAARSLVWEFAPISTPADAITTPTDFYFVDTNGTSAAPDSVWVHRAAEPRVSRSTQQHDCSRIP